jgi:hypothetical protein
MFLRLKRISLLSKEHMKLIYLNEILDDNFIEGDLIQELHPNIILLVSSQKKLLSYQNYWQNNKD